MAISVTGNTFLLITRGQNSAHPETLSRPPPLAPTLVNSSSTMSLASVPTFPILLSLSAPLKPLICPSLLELNNRLLTHSTYLYFQSLHLPCHPRHCCWKRQESKQLGLAFEASYGLPQPIYLAFSSSMQLTSSQMGVLQNMLACSHIFAAAISLSGCHLLYLHLSEFYLPSKVPIKCTIFQ